MQVMKVCQAMVQEGHDVFLTSPQWLKSVPADNGDLWQHYGLSVTFPVVWVNSRDPFLRRLYGWRAVRRAHAWGADLIYTRDPGSAAIASVLGISTVLEVHDLPGGKFGPLYFLAFLKGKGFHRLVLISRALQRLMGNRYPALQGDKDILVAPDGVDLERFGDLPNPLEARRGLGLPPESFTVGYSGHLYPGRGVGLICELARRCPQITFLLMGGNPEAVVARREQAERLRISNLVFTGFVRNAQLPLYQAACEVLLMPYQRKVEASSGGNIASVLSPLKMFEYMASGRLIVSSDLPVLREVLNESNSVLCDPEDVIAWQAAIERAGANQAWRERLATQARIDVEQYTWRRRVRRILSIKEHSSLKVDE
jgi:glycosyltransferase involved in cell wall biosynthesis